MVFNPPCMSPSCDLPTTPPSWQIFVYLVFHITTSKMRQVDVTNVMAKLPYIKTIAKSRKCTTSQTKFSKNISLKIHQVPIKTYNTSLWQPGCTTDGILRPLRANVRILFTSRLPGSFVLESVPCSCQQNFILTKKLWSWQIFVYLVFHITTNKMRQVDVTNDGNMALHKNDRENKEMY